MLHFAQPYWFCWRCMKSVAGWREKLWNEETGSAEAEKSWELSKALTSPWLHFQKQQPCWNKSLALMLLKKLLITVFQSTLLPSHLVSLSVALCSSFSHSFLWLPLSEMDPVWIPRDCVCIKLGHSTLKTADLMKARCNSKVKTKKLFSIDMILMGTLWPSYKLTIKAKWQKTLSTGWRQSKVHKAHAMTKFAIHLE